MESIPTNFYLHNVELPSRSMGAANQSIGLRDVFDMILDSLARVVPYDAANIMLIEGSDAVITACSGYENRGGKEQVMGMVRRVSEVPNLSRMVATQQPILVPNTAQSDEWVVFKSSAWIQSYLSAPICSRGTTIGFLNLNSAIPNFYSQEHAQYLLAFADQAAIAIEKSRLYYHAQAEIAVKTQVAAMLEQAKNELEIRVEDRTAQLRQAVDVLKLELERRQRAEATLEKERELLEQRIQERTAELAYAVQMKDSFLANMSHELRTPLNAILNISEVLLEKTYGDLTEKQVQLLRVSEESGRHLLSLINDVLDVSKIGAGKLELVWGNIAVHMVCEESLKLVAEAARKKNLQVATHIDPKVKFVYADHRRLKQVLVNLLSNAVKFTPAGGAIGLSVEGDEEKKQVHFVVSDRGIGISQENIGKLFKPFTQLDQGLARQYDGTGLGLNLVYHLVELHNGGVRVESTPEVGSEFSVSLHWNGDHDGITSPALPGTGETDPEGNAAQGVHRISQYLKEWGIPISSHWAGPDFDSLPPLTPSSIVLIDGFSPAMRQKILDVLAKSSPLFHPPVLVLAPKGSKPGQQADHENLYALPMDFSRGDLREAIKKLTPRGMSVRGKQEVVIIREKQVSASAYSRTILIVDDNLVSQKFIGDYLEAKGMRLIRARNGMEAVERAKEWVPDLILMDIQMPVMDGLEAIRRIRAHPQTNSIPIIAVTALAMPGDRTRCLEAGANDYLSKPLSLRHLVEKIERHFDGR